MVVVEMTSKKLSYQLMEGSFFLYMDIPASFDKPFKTYDEMLRILEDRNIIIKNKDLARRALENFSYYGLINGYKDTLLQIEGSDNFLDGTTFEELYTLHIIDTSLNSILLRYILFLERALKSRISYLVSENYGVYTNWNDFSCNNEHDYLYKNNYTNSNGNRINTLKSLKECIKDPKNNPSIIHYKTNKNHVPPWILTTNVPYGLTIQWYSILKGTDKNTICDSFISPGLIESEKTKEFVKKVFALTKEYRNKIAHGNRTFSIISLPQLPKQQLLSLTFNFISSDEYDNKMGQDDTLAVILSLIVMLNDPYIVSNLIVELCSLLTPYIEANTKISGKRILEIFGFPIDLFDRLDTLYRQKY